MPETLAELALLVVAAWALYRLLAPLQRRLQRLILRALDPSRADIVDADIVPRDHKKKKE
jgi:hypothetical protein